MPLITARTIKDFPIGNFLLRCLVPGLLLVISCDESTVQSSGSQAAVSNKFHNSDSLGRFWRLYQSSVGAKNVEEVAALVRFPIRCNLSGLEGFHDVQDQAGFERHFNTLFPAQATHAIQTSKDTPKSDIQSGKRAWSFSCNHADGASEQVWSVIYIFEEIAGGSIRLTEIQFAG
jgi:hypothetical protein